MDLVALHDQALEWAGERVAAVGDDQWTDPTPCTEWEVRDLVNHVVSENFWTGALGAGRTIEEVGDRYEGDLLGDGASGAYRASVEAASAPYHEAGALERPVAVSYGPIPGEAFLRHRVLDLVVHGWDVAKATGQDTTIDPDLLEAAARIAGEEVDMIRASGVFATDVEAPPEADTQTRLLAMTGRRP